MIYLLNDKITLPPGLRSNSRSLNMHKVLLIFVIEYEIGISLSHSC